MRGCIPAFKPAVALQLLPEDLVTPEESDCEISDAWGAWVCPGESWGQLNVEALGSHCFAGPGAALLARELAPGNYSSTLDPFQVGLGVLQLSWLLLGAGLATVGFGLGLFASPHEVSVV